MIQRSIRFESVNVLRALGIGFDQAFTLSEFSPGVNIIHGPNGSGKTTTARVIQEVLWPGCNGLQRITVSGRYHEGETTWEVSIEAGHVDRASNNQSGAIAPVGPPENRHSYYVALHELIVHDNATFAKEIAKLTQGGYDLDDAERILGFAERPSVPRSQANKLQQCEVAYRAALDRQRDIEHQTQALDQLRQDREEAAAAEREIELLKKAKDYQEKKQECRLLDLQLAEFPPGVALLRGDEREKLDELSLTQRRLETDLTSEQQRIKSADEELDEVNLRDQNVGRDLIARVRSAQCKLRQIEGEISNKRDQLAQLKGTDERVRGRIAKQVSRGQLALLGTVEIGELSRFARESDRLRSAQNAFEARHPWFERETHKRDQGAEHRPSWQWLAAENFSVEFPRAAQEVFWSPLITAVSMIAAVSLILAILMHWTWGFVLLFIPPIIFWYWRRKLKDLNEHISELCDTEAKLDRQRHDLNDRLGLTIVIGDEWLPLLIDNVGKWQLCDADAAGARRALEELIGNQEQSLSDINMALQPFGYGRVESSEAAAVLIDALEDRHRRHRAAIRTCGEARRRIDEIIEPAIRDCEEKRQIIIERLRLKISEIERINEWLKIRPEFLNLSRQMNEAKVVQEDRCRALTERGDLLVLELKEIQQRIEQLAIKADQRDNLTKQIATIEANRDTAKTGHSLSETLEARSMASAALGLERERCARAVIGALLSRWVRSEAIEKSRPDVFRRANDLLVKFARGSLELELDDYA